jgi:homoserine O-acetyltransferase
LITGAATINPETAVSLPVVSIKGFVRVQKALIDCLGNKKLKAVMGASMGWAPGVRMVAKLTAERRADKISVFVQ